MNNLDALYRKAGEKATRAVYERAAVAAGYTTDSNGPPMMTPFGAQNSRKAGEHVDWKDSVFGALSKTKTAAEDEPEDTNAAPRDAYDSPRIRETELFRRTQADTWRNLRPGQASPFDSEMDELAAPRSAFDDDRDMIELRETMARWSSGKPKRLRTSNRSLSVGFDMAHAVAMDAEQVAEIRANDAPVGENFLYKLLRPEQTIAEALETLWGRFGDHPDTGGGHWAGLRYNLATLRPSSRVHEIPNRQCISALIARMEQDHV
jgi:hypothetical protein